MNEDNIQEQLPETEQVEEQVPIREIYSEGHKAGYIAAIKQISANINDYLDNLIIATSMNQK